MREQLLAVIRAQLEQITATQSPTLKLDPKACDCARRLTQILPDDDSDLEALYVLGWFYWYQYLASPKRRKDEVLQRATQALTPCFFAGMEELPKDLLPFLVENATSTAGTLLRQAMNSADISLITATVGAWQRILAATPGNDPGLGSRQSDLGTALKLRFKRMGALEDLEKAITVVRDAVAATSDDHPNLPLYLSNLGSALQLRFERIGSEEDLTEAITVVRDAVAATSDDHPNRPGYLSNLGGVLWARFGLAGALADLDEVINVMRKAVVAATDDHDRAMCSANLGGALKARFERVGSQKDLAEAITVIRAAVAATPDDHPNRVYYLSNLGTVLRTRFERVGSQKDLAEAITVGQDAVAATPHDHPSRGAMLSNLGAALRLRFERVGSQKDLAEAITVGQDAVAATPHDHADRAVRLSNLGVALWLRSVRMGSQEDLEETITVMRAAVRAAPADRPDRSRYLSNLGTALRTRLLHAGGSEDLNESISAGRAAVAATPDDHPMRVARLCNLGSALQLRFGRIGAQTDRYEAITMYVQAANVESGAASYRIHAARLAVSLGAEIDARTWADLLEGAVRLLPETAPRQLYRSDQQYALGQFAGLASDAAALTLRADRPGPGGESPATRALGLLELGRGVLLSQALDTRSDLTDLRARHPMLAARFVELRDQLDQPEDAEMASEWADRQVADRNQLAAAFTATVADIRRRDGFEAFLLPSEPDQLLREAQHGPVVLVNVSQYGSDALLLTAGGITTVSLPKLTQNTLIDKIDSFYQALDTADLDQWSNAQDTLSAVLEWLWEAAARPILAELGYQHTPEAGTVWPRIWWIPGGLLGFLPLHAAGYHREHPEPDGERRTVLDRVISSYIPTVRALGYAREHNTAPAADQRALIVAMPTTPGLDCPLRYVTREADLVSQQLPGSTLLIEDPAATSDQLPTKAAVLAHLDDCAIAHFACHGSSHPNDPSQSLLMLHDHDTNPLTVASLGPIRLDQARLAYLSACRTSFNSSAQLIDEAIHLTAAFQLAGYPHVVGTLWEIDDAIAVRVAEDFYTALTISDNTIDTTPAAQALHHAVRTIRDELPATPSLWAAYLHAGA